MKEAIFSVLSDGDQYELVQYVEDGFRLPVGERLDFEACFNYRKPLRFGGVIKKQYHRHGKYYIKAKGDLNEVTE